MSTLSIGNLPRPSELEQAARIAVTGGTGVYPMPMIMRREPGYGEFPKLSGMPEIPEMPAILKSFPCGSPIYRGPMMGPDSGEPKVVPL
ncbi:hypothetical protein OR16_12870 [Cupriavidus basilensis OR16]|uniref:Uncharacterized protein n=1 Tax=Cupriavidus basilensis OR16 TaxID=1127483 RepID=H1S490_9BURK|nr:hypothetical protein [Cupriavidus basilensis]EHP42729.1 hypothetical protein OR16_12870 [Cupriavidus basilensis OR16]